MTTERRLAPKIHARGDAAGLDAVLELVAFSARPRSLAVALDELPAMIAAALRAQVCSIYLLEGDDVVRFSAFAGVRRPTMGRLHAAHALFRMIQLSRQTGEGAFLNRGRLWRTTRGFRRGELTSLGRTIVDEVYKAA